MTAETVAWAVADANDNVILATIRPTAGEAKGAATNALRMPGKWAWKVAIGYRLVRVAVRILDTEDPGDG